MIKKYSNVVGLRLNDKERTYTGSMGLHRKTQNMKAFDVPTPEELIQKP
jgi:hypothetical protein